MQHRRHGEAVAGRPSSTRTALGRLWQGAQVEGEGYRMCLGGDCNSTPIASDGRIHGSNNDGTTFVVKAGENFELLSTNELGERITASPAISGNDLIYRTDSHLYCIGQDR